jgi:dihydrofolate reductase
VGTLVCTAIVSADGFVNDADGRFDWAAPDAEVHAFVNDLESDVGTVLYGRRLYETMRFWEDVPDLASEPVEMQEYAALWAAAEKVVFSRTLTGVDTGRTRLVRDFDPAVVADLVARADGPVSIGGPTLAASAFAAGLVDEVSLLTVPYLAGSGTRFLPDAFCSVLQLLDSRTFGNGTVYARYAVERSSSAALA